MSHEEIEKRKHFIERYRDFIKNQMDFSEIVQRYDGVLVDICRHLINDKTLAGIGHSGDERVDLSLKCRVIKTLLVEIKQVEENLGKKPDDGLDDDLTLTMPSSPRKDELSVDQVVELLLEERTRAREPAVKPAPAQKVKTTKPIITIDESTTTTGREFTKPTRSEKDNQIVELLKRINLLTTSSESHAAANVQEELYSITEDDELDVSQVLAALRGPAESSQFMRLVKPQLVDMLKRSNKLGVFMEKLAVLGSGELKKQFKWLNERVLLCALVEAVSSRIHSRLGELLNRNDYPLPVLYQTYDPLQDELVNRVNFELLADVLCWTTRRLALFTWTGAFSAAQKNGIIQSVFPSADFDSWLQGLVGNEKKRGGGAASENASFASLDVHCNEETLGREWLVANANGLLDDEYVSREFHCLVRAMSAFSALHVVNCRLESFDEAAENEPDDEIKSFADWYQQLSRKGNKRTTLVVLIHDDPTAAVSDDDSDEEEELARRSVASRLGAISTRLAKLFAGSLVALEVHHASDLLSIRDRLITNADSPRNGLHSIFDVQKFYDGLFNNNSVVKIDVESDKRRVEREFERLFNFDLDNEANMSRLAKIFPLSSTHRSLSHLKTELQQQVSKSALLGDQKDAATTQESIQSRCRFLEAEIGKLSRQLDQVKELNSYLTFFVDVVLDSVGPGHADVLILEQLLFNLKRAKIERLRAERQELKIDESLKSGDQEKQLDLEKRRRTLDDRIEDIDLSIDKFWDELFLMFDSAAFAGAHSLERARLKEKLVDRYVQLLFGAGFAIHVLRGRPLHVESSFLKQVFDRLASRGQIYVLSVIGQQSSAKSSLLNSLFGLSFRAASGRCTIGAYMHCLSVGSGGRTLVVLDTEGLGSVDANTTIFDNQMTTMAVLSSNVVVLNHKGEISTELQRLLGITFYAKMRLSQSTFKPSIVFVLRDQVNRDDEQQYHGQAQKLNERLQKSAEFARRAPDTVFRIEAANVWLLPNAISEERDKKTKATKRWRNQIFPEEIIRLRRYLLRALFSPPSPSSSSHEKREHVVQVFSSFEHLYVKLSSNWDVLQKVGDGILSCQDLDELKVRNELANMADAALRKHLSLLSDEAFEFARQIETRLAAGSYEKLLVDFENMCDARLAAMLDDFQRQTSGAGSDFPESMRRLAEARIRASLESKRSRKLGDLKEQAFRFVQRRRLRELEAQMARWLAEMDPSSRDFQAAVEREFGKLDAEFERLQSETSVQEDALASRIREYYLDNLQTLGHACREFVDLATSYELTYFKAFLRGSGAVDSSLWIGDAHLRDQLTSEAKQLVFGVEERVKKSIIPAVEAGLSSQRFDSSHVRSALVQLSELLAIFQPTEADESAELESKNAINRQLLVHDTVLIVLRHVYVTVLKNQEKKRATDAAEYAQMKAKWRQEVESRASERKSAPLAEPVVAGERKNSKPEAASAGAKLGEKLLSGLSEFVCAREKLVLEQFLESAVEKYFEKPEALLDLAYKRSFDRLDYVGVVKYVTNLKKFCAEIFAEQTRDDLAESIDERLEAATASARKFVESVASLDAAVVKSSSVLSIVQEISDYFSKSSTELKPFAAYLLSLRESTSNAKVDDAASFLNSLKDAVRRFDAKELARLIETLKRTAKELILSKQSEYVRQNLGCTAKCPGCGAKCQHAADHAGDHKAHVHLLAGFSGKKSIARNDEVSTDFCFSKKNYLDTSVGVGRDPSGNYQISFPNMKAMIASKDPGWSEDMEANYRFFSSPDAAKNKSAAERAYKIIKCWMNTRKLLISRFNVTLEPKDAAALEKLISDGNLSKSELRRLMTLVVLLKSGKSRTYRVNDRTDYPKDWLQLEDANKLAPGTVINGYDYKPYL